MRQNQEEGMEKCLVEVFYETKPGRGNEEMSRRSVL